MQTHQQQGQSSSTRAQGLVTALIRHSAGIDPEKAQRAASAITETFQLQPRTSPTIYGATKKTTTKKKSTSKPTRSKGYFTEQNFQFVHVHESHGLVGNRPVDVTINENAVIWGQHANQLVINLSRKQVKRLRAALSAYLQITEQGTGEMEEEFAEVA